MLELEPEWRSPPAFLELPANQVHLWRVWLDQPPEVVQALQLLLSEDEQARAERFRRSQDRLHFIVGRAALRQLLGQYLAIAPQALQFCYSDRGKPGLAAAHADGSLQFNLSHSHGLALCAVTRDRRIGIDLEQVRPLEQIEQLTHRCFSAREYGQFCSLPVDQRLAAFFQGWTCKEAYLKATGEGLARLEQVEVSLLPTAPAQIVALAQTPQAVADWSLQMLRPARNYIAALAVEGHDWYSTCWQWLNR